jgi:hypothetical protein
MLGGRQQLKGLPSSPAPLSNGSRIISLPGDGDSVRGFSAPSMCVCGEAAYISDVLHFAIRPMQDF